MLVGAFRLQDLCMPLTRTTMIVLSSLEACILMQTYARLAIWASMTFFRVTLILLGICISSLSMASRRGLALPQRGKCQLSAKATL